MPLEPRDGTLTAPWLRPLDRAFAQFLARECSGLAPEVALAAALASYQLGRGHVCLDLEAVLDQPARILGLAPGELGRFADLNLADWLASLRASPVVGSDGSGAEPLVLAGSRLYLRRYWAYEMIVAGDLIARAARRESVPADLAARLERLFPAEAGGGVWQKIACALAVRGRFALITGGPGTGKTTTVVRLLALLLDTAAPGQALRFALAAPTGKAAARLNESITRTLARDVVLRGMDLAERLPQATTLHRLLGSRPDTRRFRHDARQPLALDLLVVDEASMIDLSMMAALLAALPATARLVLLGDKDQLASVEAGSVLGDLCREAEAGRYDAATLDWLRAATGEDLSAYAGAGGPLAAQTAMLRISHRFGADSGIGALARAVNAGSPAALKSAWDGGYGDIARLALGTSADARFARLVLDGETGHGAAGADRPRGYRHYLELIRTKPAQAAPDEPGFLAWVGTVLAALDEFRLLCALRRGDWGVEGINARVEAILAEAGLIAPSTAWYEGRPVLVTRNDYGLGLMNGDVGLALKVQVPGASGPVAVVRVFFQTETGLRSVSPSRLGEVETVYAMTVHKSQGSEFAHTALVLPELASPVLSRELVYTGITRAKTWFTLVGPELGLVDGALKAPTVRASGLGELLG